MSTCNVVNFERTDDPEKCTQVDIGSDWNRPIKQVKLSTGDPIDITGITYQMIIKDVKGGSVLLTLDHVGAILLQGIYIPTPANGEMFLQIPDDVSTSIGGGVYPFEIMQTSASGFKKMFINGTIEFYSTGF